MDDPEEQVLATDDAYQRYQNNLTTLSFPRRVTIELTNRCNLSCPMCPREIVKVEEDFSEGFMTVALFRKIADEIAEHPGVAMIPFFRGESLLHPNATEMLRYATSRGVAPVQLTTNATVLTERIARELLDLGLDFISFSLDAVTKRAYEAVRVGAHYERVMANIERFLALRAAHPGPKPEVQVSMVEGMDTESSEQAFVERWLPHVDRVRVYTRHSTDGHFGSLPGAGAGADDGERRPCLKLLTDLVVYWDGTVALCNHDWDRKEPMGDVRRATIAEVWRGPAYEALRRQHLEDRYMPGSVCATCAHWRTSYVPERLLGRLYSADGHATVEGTRQKAVGSKQEAVGSTSEGST